MDPDWSMVKTQCTASKADGASGTEARRIPKEVSAEGLPARKPKWRVALDAVADEAMGSSYSE